MTERMTPEQSPLWSSEVDQPFTRRVFNMFLGLFLFVLALAAFSGWYFTRGEDPATVQEGDETNVNLTYAPNYGPASPGTAVAEGTNFLENLFSGFGGNNTTAALAMSGTGVSGLQPAAAASRPTMPPVIDNVITDAAGEPVGTVHDILIRRENGMAGIVIRKTGSGETAQLTALPYDDVMQQEQNGAVQMSSTAAEINALPAFDYNKLDQDRGISLRAFMAAQILDDRGEVAGHIQSVRYENAQLKDVFFGLETTLAQSSAVQQFMLPFESLNIVRNADGYDIVLNAEQTRALSAQAFPVANNEAVPE